MTNDDDRIDNIFNQALSQPQEERATFLGSACNGDGELQREVESLLDAASEMDEDFLEKPILSLNEDPQ